MPKAHRGAPSFLTRRASAPDVKAGSLAAAGLLGIFGLLAACSSDGASTGGSAASQKNAATQADSLTQTVDPLHENPSSSSFDPSAGPTTTDTPIGLAFEIENGVGKPVDVRAGQTFFIDQIDIRAFQDTTVDEGISAISRTGDFSRLQWKGLQQEDQSPLDSQNADGTYTQRRFFRDATWMESESLFAVEQVDSRGIPLGLPLVLSTGKGDKRGPSDSFWVRRFRGIQWIYDCATTTTCPGATSFQEEALVELRNSMHPDQTFRIHPQAAALKVVWSANPERPYTIPLTQVPHPEWDYGFKIDVDALTPPQKDGTYAPGTDIELQVTLRDGAGKRLHEAGSLPKYPEAAPDASPSGITYYRAFYDATTTYYRRKHRERNFISTFEGPAQLIQQSRSLIPTENFLVGPDVQTIATPATDGYYAFMRIFPTATTTFGGGFDPTHAAWANDVPDTWTYHVPDDAPAGTYLVATKARRVYLGQDIPYTSVINVQVGTPMPTTTPVPTGNCGNCHKADSSLSVVNHANARLDSCTGCHVPLGFELEGPIYVRTHFLHSRSRRFEAPLAECKTCHFAESSIQRTSKSACLSCHKSYPDSHVEKFGPIDNMYVGGDFDSSFPQCTSECHTTHPDSGF
jgi:hypothetical protein